MPRGEFKHRYWFFADAPNIARNCSEPILTVVSNIGEDVQYRCFNSVCDVKSVSQPETMEIIIHFKWQKQASLSSSTPHRMGLAPDLVDNLSVNSFKWDQSNATTVKAPLFSLLNAFNSIVNLYRRNGRIQTTSIGTKFIPDFEIFVFNLVWIHSTNLVNITLLHQIPLWNSFQHSCFYYCFLANTGLCLSICTS